MTRLRGASLDGPSATQQGGSERSQYTRSKIPPNAPEVIVQNTLEVTDPSRVLPAYRDERRRQFNLLVRRYKNQLLHGCDDPECRTPTCASRRRRVSKGPYRRYTELSARTLACYLASQDDPESGLCCNKLRYSSDMTIYDYHRISLQRSRAFQAHAVAVAAEESRRGPQALPDQMDNFNDETPANLTQEAGVSTIASGIAGTTFDDVQPNTSDFQDLDYIAEQPLKDPKSFTQNLFDTLSLRMVEWLPLRRTGENLQPPRSRSMFYQASNETPNFAKRQEKGTDKRRTDTSQVLPVNTRNPLPRTPSSRTSGTQPSAVELTFQEQHVKRLSLHEADKWRQSSRSSPEEKKRPEYKSQKLPMNAHLASNEFTSMPSPPSLKRRPQKRRGRAGDLDKVQSKDHPKNQRRVSWDSEKLLTETTIGASTENLQPPPPQSEIDIDTPTNRKLKPSSMRRTPNVAALAQSISHFTPEIIDGLSQVMFPSQEDAEAWREELDRMQSMGSFDNPDWIFATPHQRDVFPFIAQSVHFIFSNAGQILRSFRRDALEFDTVAWKMDPRLDVSKLQGSLQRLFAICPWDIALHSVWTSLDKLFLPPSELASSGRPSRRSSRSSTMTGSAPPVIRRLSESVNNEHLSDADAAYIATVAFNVLVSSLPDLEIGTWRGILRMRAAGTVASSADMQKMSPEQAQQAVEVTDRLEHQLGLRLINRLVRALAARIAYYEISKSRQVHIDLPKHLRVNVLDRIVDHLREQRPQKFAGSENSSSDSVGPIRLIVEWLRTLFLREWDGNPEMACSSAAGGAVKILALMHKRRHLLGLQSEDFHTPILAERLDPLEMPVAWLRKTSNNRTMHLLSNGFLFPPSFLVIYFRALNYSAMSKSYEAALTTTRHINQSAFSSIAIADEAALLDRMKVSMSTALVLEVRRDNVLTDALNQLWRREKRELMRPLKVRMGMDEGEEGLDHGGVQQEFFRVLMGEALDPSYGMFTMDSRHRTSWFQPCSWEPLYKFELLGLLMSIAVFNGLTLPVNFPVAFYRKLLGKKVIHRADIRDGWPELCQGLDSLLTWSDGDVGDVFMRTYEFSFESSGSVETVDMQKVGRDDVWPVSKATRADTADHEAVRADESHDFASEMAPLPSPMSVRASNFTSSASSSADAAETMRPSPPPSPMTPTVEAPLVTNENRYQFVDDYIFWLTDKSIRPQFEAFLQGFYTCLDRTALTIFTPEALKTVVEGIQHIDIAKLEHHARYEGGFGPTHRVIRDFWSIVRQYSPEKKAQLLEFVTASDRIPVNGISSIMFVIQKNGVGDLRLPTSLTCFGRLLLPEYTSKEALAEKLDKALENARGFGFA